jgi:hypothetical protein
LTHVRYPALCGLKSDIASGPKSAINGHCGLHRKVPGETKSTQMRQPCQGYA